VQYKADTPLSTAQILISSPLHLIVEGLGLNDGFVSTFSLTFGYSRNTADIVDAQLARSDLLYCRIGQRAEQKAPSVHQQRKLTRHAHFLQAQSLATPTTASTLHFTKSFSANFNSSLL
jgi:hypothetical protein